MGKYRFSRSLRIISAIVLSFFCWTFAGGVDVACAIKEDSQKSAVDQQQTDTPKRGEKFGKDIEDIHSVLKDAATDTDTKKQKLHTKKAEIEADDVEIRKHFKETEEEIQELPEAIKQRHRDFVRKYEENLKTLKDDLDEIDRAKTEPEKQQAIQKTQDFLEKVKPPKKHKKLDPNNLPNRTEEPVFKEPRTKPEEFTEGKELRAESKGQKPILVASNGSLKGLLSPDSSFHAQSSMQIAMANPPTAADLAETIEVQFTPAIKAKAAELGYKPVKIYNWVRNNIEYVPTYGSIQGANMCLQTKQCNDADTASLLIALLRASGIHARYVYGTIEVPIEKVKNWVGGFTDTNAALTLIASGSIPVTGLTSGGIVQSVRKEHVWVEAWIDYIPSRGSVYKQGDTWIPLDASFKEFTYKKGIDVKSVTGFNPQSFLDNITAASIIDPVTGAVKNLPVSNIQSQMTTMVNTIKNYIDTTMPNATVGDVFGAKNIVQHNYRILAATLPYNVVVTGNKLSEVTDSLRHKVTVTIGDPYGMTPPLSYSASLPQLASKRITLAYMPLTSSDAQVLATYGPFTAQPYLFGV